MRNAKIVFPENKPLNPTEGFVGLKSLVKALRVLKLFSSKKGGLTIGEMVKILGFHRSSIQRIVNTLEAEGFLERDKGFYRLGPQILQLEAMTAQNIEIERLARPALERLAHVTQETAHLYVINKRKACCLAGVETPRSVRLVSNEGKRVPLHCTGVGKVLMSGLNQVEVDEVVEREGLPKFTENTICDPGELSKELASIRQRGFALDNEEYELGVKCIAAPVLDSQGKVLAVIDVSGPSYRITTEILSRFAVFVKEATTEVSEKLDAAGGQWSGS